MRILPTEEENAVSMRCSFLSVRTGLEARRSDRTLRASVSKHPVHPNSMTLRKHRAIDGHGEVLSNGVERRRRDHEDWKRVEATGRCERASRSTQFIRTR